MSKQDKMDAAAVTVPPNGLPDFTTSSMFCAAWLLYQNREQSGFRMISAKRGEFVFKMDEETKRDVAAFYDDTAEVNLKRYIRFFNRARDTVMDHRREADATDTRDRTDKGD